ncbi:MAG: hypothetical protein CUN49_03815 [Candidatus Thermofonsia Clade 1 bacterium]|jgi:hypothetical protein|uniref:YbjN domain-containing protein n=1 Tax=Candidatus Thermofonsia Clade 1 bacterium TaxID=2364210 RepID=A0A2M8PGS0_9CHLR|nr:MAG: hypothetical protein CUN49_03815 [Candidatus Thermofonsia Clade 1 bacterium]PJF43082.1 MAG: hypothetical protein CUN50_01460 [Candidatus Thermofonsia Clade 1 bacterium]RMF49609.1 MAG: hypothetical protein D6749_12745 [Chloroflexota bacterium]
MDELQPIHAAMKALEAQGWQVNADAAGWQLQRESCRLYADINTHWLYFSLPVLQTQPEAHYLQASQRLCLCKYACDAHGQLLLQAELPLLELERTYIHTVVEALWRAAQQHDQPLQRSAAAAQAEPNREYFSRLAMEMYFKGLRHQGWGFRKPISLNAYHFHYKAAERPFEVYLTFDSAWAYWQVPILEGAAASAWWRSRQRDLLCRYLLAFNEQLYWARFVVDDEANVLLLLDVPLSLFSAARFQLSAETIAQYAADYAYEILILAELGRDEGLARLLTAHLRGRLEFPNN